jgi:ribonucleoside-triphosphate reductase
MNNYLLVGNTDLPIYYANGTHVPVGADVEIFERLEIEQVFYHGLTGGDLTHLFIGEAHPVAEGLMELGMRIAKNTQIGYFVPSRDLTVCLSCRHIEGGLHECCTNCGDSEVEYIARVTGYMSTVSSWNAAKRQELDDRRRVGVDGTEISRDGNT